MHAQGGLPIPGIEHIEQPYWWQHGRTQGLTREAFGLLAAGWLEERILAIGPDKVAAFIGEPIQGAGGGDHPTQHLLARGRRRIRQRSTGVLLGSSRPR